jgi:hypothetical protein
MLACSLADWANISSIFTGIVAAFGVLAYLRSVYVRHQKLVAFEGYLSSERAKGPRHGQRSIKNIIQHVGLTEDEILNLSFSSRHIRRLVITDGETKLAKELLFQYDPDYKKPK